MVHVSKYLFLVSKCLKVSVQAVALKAVDTVLYGIGPIRHRVRVDLFRGSGTFTILNSTWKRHTFTNGGKERLAQQEEKPHSVWVGLSRASYFGRNLITQAMYFGRLRYWLYSLRMSKTIMKIVQKDLMPTKAVYWKECLLAFWDLKLDRQVEGWEGIDGESPPWHGQRTECVRRGVSYQNYKNKLGILQMSDFINAKTDELFTEDRWKRWINHFMKLETR